MKKKNEFYENLIKNCSWNKAAENVKEANEAIQNVKKTEWFEDKYGWVHSTREAALAANEGYN